MGQNRETGIYAFIFPFLTGIITWSVAPEPLIFL